MNVGLFKQTHEDLLLM